MSPWKPLPGDGPDPRPVAESLPRLAHRLGAPPPDVLSSVFARWADIVGPTVAAHSWPLSLKEGLLRIGVDQAGWATQLTFLGPDLLRQLADATGSPTVSRIDVKVVGNRPG